MQNQHTRELISANQLPCVFIVLSFSLVDDTPCHYDSHGRQAAFLPAVSLQPVATEISTGYNEGANALLLSQHKGGAGLGVRAGQVKKTALRQTQATTGRLGLN